MIQRLGDMPVHLATRGKHAATYFTPEGDLRMSGRRQQRQPLDRLLVENYGLPPKEVRPCTACVLPGFFFRVLCEVHKRANRGVAAGVDTGYIPLLAQPTAAPPRPTHR